MSNTKKKVDIQGDISIHTENILPIIKKWLYSENEIFIRELASNSHDAITKLQKVAVMESLTDIETEGKIQITLDKDKKTITISDNGIGMTSEEVQKYINQIAFSGAEEFIEKYKDKDDQNQVIGHFGLGFYSSFIVSDLVEIKTKSYKKDEPAMHWSCDGTTKFSLKEGNKTTVGTDVILHVNEDCKDYLDEAKLKTLVQKYANFLPIEVKVGEEVANNQNPLWVKQPNEVSDEEYKEFYKTLFPYNQEPLFWIHLNVDYPFNLQGILYFPKLVHELDAKKGKIQLYCQQVYVTDEAKDVVPEFLTLLQGAIDCPEIPLNVSRSYLQNDPYVKKISKHIVKKVADRLNELYKKDREKLESYWEDISPFIKYGMMTNDDFFDKAKELVMFESSEDKVVTLNEYLERNKEKHENKVLYCADKGSQAGYVKLCKDQGLEVLFTHAVIDSHFIQFLESKNSETKFVSVDSELTDFLKEDTDSKDDKKKEEKNPEAEKCVDVFKKALGDDKLDVKVEALKADTIPAMILQPEFVKRMATMSHMSGGMQMPQMDTHQLVINSNNSTIKAVLNLSENKDKQETVKKLCSHIYDLAKLNQKPLTGDDMQTFIQRSNELVAIIAES
ncbi:molecular chaperone HtpG [Candidatus Marinamargulisbacteria bacterium SCGC AAA071-K20]|nr:molecular chaperone HtpG [Candidatus Marinamargulisbacteria bacterium SCGC AAA071-K20]